MPKSGAERKKRWIKNKRAQGLTNSMIVGPSSGGHSSHATSGGGQHGGNTARVLKEDAFLWTHWIAFSQKTAKLRFSDGTHMFQRMIEIVCSDGHAHPESFILYLGNIPRIRVARHPDTSQYHTADNRRLLMFRALGFRHVRVDVTEWTEEYDNKLAQRDFSARDPLDHFANIENVERVKTDSVSVKRLRAAFFKTLQSPYSPFPLSGRTVLVALPYDYCYTREDDALRRHVAARLDKLRCTRDGFAEATIFSAFRKRVAMLRVDVENVHDLDEVGVKVSRSFGPALAKQLNV
ncbi:unnamed protein product [Amoebophrya sp. A120]|nr:unnamed protein product [Amoebophrya sp. A120]|eukprot:GSA120T00006401001.1